MNDLTSRWRAFFNERVKGNKELVEAYLRFVDRLAVANLPPIFELRHFSELIGMENSLVIRFCDATETFYRTIRIPKRRGGSRELSIPSPSLKAAQSWIKEEILDKLPIHDCVYGFVRGRSVVGNAVAHVNAKAHARVDIRDFFPSIGFSRVLAIFSECGYPPNVSYALARICTLNEALPQGAPTSPPLSNAVFFNVDVALAEFAQRNALIYTRYADDITFSGDEVSITPHLDEVSRILYSFGFCLNEAKTLLTKTGRKVVITGVSISGGRLALPRSAVRKIKADVHLVERFGLMKAMEVRGNFDPFFLDRLKGRLAFWLQIDPNHPTARRLLARLNSVGVH